MASSRRFKEVNKRKKKGVKLSEASFQARISE